jgi:hypothetical protein
MRTPQTFVITLLQPEVEGPVSTSAQDERGVHAPEPCAAQQDMWRGKVVHVASNRQVLFTSLEDLMRFFVLCLANPGDV